jgi:hypothetical protein
MIPGDGRATGRPRCGGAARLSMQALVDTRRVPGRWGLQRGWGAEGRATPPGKKGG